MQEIRKTVHKLNEQGLVAKLWTQSLEVMRTLLAHGHYHLN